jgi:hypothetical protein
MSKKKSKKGAQGGELPPDRSPLEDYPIGSCVLLDVEGDPIWYLVSFRIGKTGDPHCGKLNRDPSSSTWNHGMADARQTDCRRIVLASAWPNRPGQAGAGGGAEQDPLASGDASEGSLMLGHLSDQDQPSDERRAPFDITNSY